MISCNSKRIHFQDQRLLCICRVPSFLWYHAFFIWSTLKLSTPFPFKNHFLNSHSICISIKYMCRCKGFVKTDTAAYYCILCYDLIYTKYLCHSAMQDKSICWFLLKINALSTLKLQCLFDEECSRIILQLVLFQQSQSIFDHVL